jgi:hypothetical protein
VVPGRHKQVLAPPAAAWYIRGSHQWQPTIVKEGNNLDEGSGSPYTALKERNTYDTALGKPGDDLLSRVLRRSTIGAGAFHGRVRDGIGCSRSANITRPAKGSVKSGL